MSVGVRVATSEVPSSCQLPIPATLKARGSWCRLRRLRFLPGSSCVRGCPAANWSGRGRCRSGSSTRAGSFALAGCVERSGYGRPVATQAVYYRSSDGVEPVAEFLDREFPLEPRKKSPSVREIEAAATKRMTVDLQIDRLNGLASDDPPLPFPQPRRSMARCGSLGASLARRRVNLTWLRCRFFRGVASVRVR